VVGLTVVAFGTSAPELSVNLSAAFQGNSDISFGNIIGSNIANIGLILGISALVRPLAIKGRIITREIPIMLLASVLTLLAGLDTLLRQAPNMFDRTDGLVLLLVFCVFLYTTIGDVLSSRSGDPFLEEVEGLAPKRSFPRIIANLTLFAAGLLLLILGGRLAVSGAVGAAELLQIPKAVIGLTIIAVGTSLPELVTSGVATWKGQTDIAIGNVVGSNIFNLLFIAGLSATVTPIPVPAPGGWQDLVMMVFLSLFLLPLCLTDSKRLVRREGALLLALYLGFNVWRVAAG
jgi:cation:H+ antiporter